MNCQKCGSDNRKGVKFCEECGVMLELECPTCKAKLPLGKKFCGECGHALKELQEIPAILEEKFVRAESELLWEEIDNASTTHQQRVKISDRLAEIGDPRPG
ncbi:MAG: zinc ribbon domain-containing protein, partial [Deltaproteobacteria bacterium]|nr:zinc ribbon domain-containing protein [Deltaproteobacteria bacterium]